jgi:hypothetical protein
VVFVKLGLALSVTLRRIGQQLAQGAIELLLGVAHVVRGHAGHPVCHQPVKPPRAGHHVIEFGTDEILNGLS